jgi:hypothetical protein
MNLTKIANQTIIFNREILIRNLKDKVTIQEMNYKKYIIWIEKLNLWICLDETQLLEIL